MASEVVLALARNWKITRASDGDAPAILALHKVLNRPPRVDSRTSEYFVAWTEGKVIGCAAVRKNGDVGYLYGLAVDKSWRRRGVGHALTQQRLDWLRNEAANSAYVLAMFWNVRFFRKHGFQLADRSLRCELAHLHGDFSQSWTVRSALLMLKFSETQG
jgi:N-acetylglutamate synthase-like GNAT family acetyltransferase